MSGRNFFINNLLKFSFKILFNQQFIHNYQLNIKNNEYLFIQKLVVN